MCLPKSTLVNPCLLETRELSNSLLSSCLLSPCSHSSFPLPFPSSLDQLVDIIKILGTPSKDQINAMNPKVRLSLRQRETEEWRCPLPYVAASLISLPFFSTNQQYQDHKFPSIRPHPFVKFFRPRTDPLALDLLERTLVYAPKKRLDAFGVMAHPFFDELRVEGAKMANGDELPGLFK